MSRVLRRAEGKQTLVAFDEATGQVAHTESTAPATGVLHMQGSVALAFYADADSLVVQVGTERFRLNDAAVRVRYSHHAGLRETTFAIEHGARRVELRYEAWWSELGLTPPHVRIQPEEDEHEDYLGFIAAVAADTEHQAQLLAHWRP